MEKNFSDVTLRLDAAGGVVVGSGEVLWSAEKPERTVGVGAVTYVVTGKRDKAPRFTVVIDNVPAFQSNRLVGERLTDLIASGLPVSRVRVYDAESREWLTFKERV